MDKVIQLCKYTVMKNLKLPTSFISLIFLFGMFTYANAESKSQAITLKYESNLAKVGFGSPFLEAQVGEAKPALFLVDTGAASNVVFSWYSKVLNKKVKSAVEVPDSTGNMIKMNIINGDLKVGTKLFEKQVFLEQENPDFRKHKIAGIVSPKSLGSVVVLDLKTPQMKLYSDLKDALNEYKMKLIPRKEQTTCVAPASSLYSVPASIQSGNIKLLVDTGATTTKIYAGSDIGKKLRKNAVSTGKMSAGLSGKRTQTFQLPKGKVNFADSDFSLSIGVIDSNGKGCPSDGILGQDILKHCILAMAKDDIAVTCKK